MNLSIIYGVAAALALLLAAPWSGKKKTGCFGCSCSRKPELISQMMKSEHKSNHR